MSHPVGGEFLGNNYGNIEDAEIEAAGGDELIFCNAATTSATLAVNAKLSATTVIAGTEVTLTLSSELEQEEVLDMYDYGHIFVLVYSIEATITFGGKTYTTTLDAGDVNDMTSLTYIASPDATVKLTTTGLTGKQTINIQLKVYFGLWTTPMGQASDEGTGSITNKSVTVNPATATLKRGTLSNVSAIYYGTSSSSQTTQLTSTSGVSLTAGTYYFRYVLSSATGYTYTFSSWSGSLSGTGSPKSLTLSAGSTYTIGASATRAANAYSISYDLNGGSWPSGYTSSTYHPTSVNYNTTINIVHPTYSGYTFSRWMVSGVNSSTAYQGNSSSSLSSYNGGDTNCTYFKNLTPTNGGKITFTAAWTANSYTVTLNTNKGSGSTTPTGGTTSVNATYNSAMPSITVPTRAGYTFQGYYDTSAATGGTQYYTATGSSARAWNKASATTLYARWTANKYTVTLNQNGGRGGTTSVTATFDATMLSITVPTRDGWRFLGYYDAQTGGTQYYTATGASARLWNKTANTTLYAQWQEKTWIDYKASGYDGGNGTASNLYQIRTAEQLGLLAYQCSVEENGFSGKYFIQTADIDLNAHQWYNIGSDNTVPFCGNYDGNLYQIENIRMQSVDIYQGLFGAVANATIKNVHIVGATILNENGNDAGGLIGDAQYCTIINCVVESVTIVGSGEYSGGLAGWLSNCVVQNCMVKNCSINASYSAGGIAGSANGSIQDCNVINATISSGNSGMIAGEDSDIGLGCYGYGTINGTTTKVMYGNETAWTNWSLVDGINGGLPVQKGLFHIGGFTDSKTVHDYLVGQGYVKQ